MEIMNGKYERSDINVGLISSIFITYNITLIYKLTFHLHIPRKTSGANKQWMGHPPDNYLNKQHN